MSGHKSISILGLYMSLILFLSACTYPQQKIIDDIQIQTVLGFDKDKEEYIGTTLYPDFTKEEENGEGVILEGKGSKVRLIKQELDEQSPKPIEIGKLNLLVFGRELAEDSVSYFVKTVCRDPLVGSNMFLAVTEGHAGELLKKGQNKSSNYIYKLIEHNYRSQNIPLPTLQSFLFDYYGEGRDVSIPYLRINQKGNIEVNGLAVFKKEKLKLILDQKETFLYKILRGRIMKGETDFKIHIGQREGSALLTVLYGENKKFVSIKQSNTKVKINIELQGMVKDYPVWLNLSKNKNKILLKKQLEKQLKKDFEDLLLKFKDDQVDPLGIGDLVRAHSRNWSEKEFYENVYPNLTYDLDLTIELTRAGIGV